MPTSLPRLEKTLPLLIVAKRLGFRSEFLRQLTLSRKKKCSNPAFSKPRSDYAELPVLCFAVIPHCNGGDRRPRGDGSGGPGGSFHPGGRRRNPGRSALGRNV